MRAQPNWPTYIFNLHTYSINCRVNGDRGYIRSIKMPSVCANLECEPYSLKNICCDGPTPFNLPILMDEGTSIEKGCIYDIYIIKKGACWLW